MTTFDDHLCHISVNLLTWNMDELGKVPHEAKGLHGRKQYQNLNWVLSPDHVAYPTTNYENSEDTWDFSTKPKTMNPRGSHRIKKKMYHYLLCRRTATENQDILEVTGSPTQHEWEKTFLRTHLNRIINHDRVRRSESRKQKKRLHS